VPTTNEYREIFNSDSDRFGGSNIHNPQAKTPYHENFSEAPYHITVSVPPLAGIILQPQATDT
jgi:1,4-alpha-glucan branching enzyme